MLFLDTAWKMIDKRCRYDFVTQKNYILMNMSAECAFCFLIKLKNTFIQLRVSFSI
jgi:hypothetical protein